jgi:hypothetical protein
MSDVTIKEYTRGKLAGKVALFFNTDKAKQEYKKMLIDSLYCIAYDKTDTIMEKAERFCTDRQLHYEIVIN